MVGTDSWEKGEQFDASGTGYMNDYTAQFTSTVGGSVQDMWQSSYRRSTRRIPRSLRSRHSTGSTRGDEEHAPRREPVPSRAVLLQPRPHLRRGAAQSRADAGRFDAGPSHARGFDLPWRSSPISISPIANLPLKGAQTDYFRATKGAAQTLLAEVYLTRAATGDFDKAATSRRTSSRPARTR